MNIFSTGPATLAPAVYDAIAPAQLKRQQSNLAPALDTPTLGADVFRDDDDQPAFFIPPLLEGSEGNEAGDETMLDDV